MVRGQGFGKHWSEEWKELKNITIWIIDIIHKWQPYVLNSKSDFVTPFRKNRDFKPEAQKNLKASISEFTT